MASKPPVSPTNQEGNRDDLSTADSSRGRTPQPGAVSKKGMTPRVGAAPAPPASARGGAGKPATAAAPAAAASASDAAPGAHQSEEHKEPSDDDYLRKLYAEQKEQERIKALELSHETLVATCAELHRSLASMDQKHTHMFLYKQRETAKQVEHQKLLDATIADLSAQIEALQASHKAASAAAAQTHLEEVVALEERMAVIQAKYESLAQFQAEKNDMEMSLHKYRQLLEQEKANHALNVAELERRNVMEKDRLKNEMLRKIRETKLSLLAMTEDQLHTTTKRTIMENEQMTTELQYQSKETERIVRRNEKLAAENAALKRELELAHSTQQMMAKKTMFYQNLIGKLQGKLDTMAAEKEREKSSFVHAQIAWQNQMAVMQAHQQHQQHGHQGGRGRRGHGHAHAHGHAHGGHAGVDPDVVSDRTASSLSNILRGVDEMAQLASSANGGGPAVHHHQPILPRTISGQSHRKNEQQQSLSRASLTSSSTANSGGGNGGTGSHPQGSQEDAAMIARLQERAAALERDKCSWLDAHKQLTAQLREAQSARQAAESALARLESEVVELRSTVARLRGQRTQGSQLGEAALHFLSCCLEDQRLARTGAAESAATARADEVAATLAPVHADGSEATVVVTAPGERPLQGGAPAYAKVAAAEVGAAAAAVPGATGAGASTPSGAGGQAGTSTDEASPLPVSPGGSGGGGWDPSRGFPSSLASLSPSDRVQVLELLMQQLAAFQRSNPAPQQPGAPSPSGSGPTAQTDHNRSGSHSSSSSILDVPSASVTGHTYHASSRAMQAAMQATGSSSQRASPAPSNRASMV